MNDINPQQSGGIGVPSYVWLGQRMVSDVRCIHHQLITEWCGTCLHEAYIAFGQEAHPLAEVVEKVLLDEWHQDQCACRDWPDRCLYVHLTPSNFTVEAVLYAADLVQGASS